MALAFQKDSKASLFEQNEALGQAEFSASAGNEFWGFPRMPAEVKMSMGESKPCG